MELNFINENLKQIDTIKIDKLVDSIFYLNSNNQDKIVKLSIESILILSVSNQNLQILQSSNTISNLYKNIILDNKQFTLSEEKTVILKYASQQLLKKFLDMNLVSIGMIAFLNNKLTTSIFDSTEEIVNAKENLKLFFHLSSNKKFDLKVNELNLDKKLTQWKSDFSQHIYSNKSYETLDEFSKIMYVTFNFLYNFNKVYTIKDLILLKDLFKSLNIDLKKQISYEYFFQYLIKSPNLIKYIFHNINNNILSNETLHQLPILSGMINIYSFLGHESNAMHTLWQDLKKSEDEYCKSEIILSLIKNQLANNAFVNTSIEIGIFNLVSELLFSLQFIKFQPPKPNIDIFNNITTEDLKYLEIYDEINIAWNKEVDDWIYYVNTYENDKLFRMHKETKKKQIVINSKIENVVIYKNFIFYTLKREGKNILIRCNLEGTETTLINNALCSNTSYCVGDNKIYYCQIGRCENHIKQIDLQSGFTTVIYNPLEYASHLHYCNNHIYYRKVATKNNKDEILKKISVETKKEEMIETFYNNLFISKNHIIFKDSRSGNLIIKDLTNNKRLHKIEKCNEILTVCNGYVLFTYEGFTDIETKYVKNMLYSLNINNNYKVVKMTDCNVCKVQIIKNYIYYKTKSEDNIIYRQRIDGTDKKILNNINTRNSNNKKFVKKLLNKIPFLSLILGILIK